MVKKNDELNRIACDLQLKNQ